MVKTKQFIAFPDNVINVSSSFDFEALICDLPEQVITDLDNAILKLQSFETSLYAAYRVANFNLKSFVDLKLLNFYQEIEIEDVFLFINKDGLYAQLSALVNNQHNFWFVQLKMYKNGSLTDENSN
ncbi:hypothetical protein [Acinetobacter nosocomialis]|uniref:hypothetical protein n=1 Tax=Acinetobacter nosocomialis TaxID=106654 RepID=UPI0029DB884A|nr:hypothetical protein [Acinetobacter nosocomialis]MDX7882107.1 hypothetical protein [Acinetobacter nosocomialis]